MKTFNRKRASDKTHLNSSSACKALLIVALGSISSQLYGQAPSMALGYIQDTDGPGFETVYTNASPGSQAALGYIDFLLYNQTAKWTWWRDAHNFPVKQMELGESSELKLLNGADPSRWLMLSPAPAGDGYGQRISGYGSHSTGENTGFISFTRIDYAGTGVQIGTKDGAVLNVVRNGSTLTNNVGIGTLTPASKLDVVGDIRLSGNIIKAGGGTLQLPASGTLTLPSTGGTLISNIGTQTITGATTLEGVTTLGGTSAAQRVVVDVTGKVAIGGAPSGTAGKFSVITSSQPGRQVVMGDGDGANALLTIRGDDNGVSRINLQNLSASATIGHGFGLWTYFGTTTSSTPVQASSLNVLKETEWTSTSSSQNAAMTFALATAGSAPTEKMRINSAGNVGIGTITPAAKLSVVGGVASSQMGVHINNTATNGYSVLRLGTDSVAATGTALHDFGSTHTASGNAGAYQADQTALSSFRPNGLSLHANANAPIKFFTAGYAVSNERMRIAGDGNVGIGTGTTAPAAKLDVNGDAKVATTLTVGGNLAVNGLATKLRVAEQGDISMGAFTAQP